MCTANQVADYLLSIQDEESGDISNMKLQKLLYYAQGAHLALYSKPLFSDTIEVWTHGPVVPSVYHRFKKHSGNVIPAPNKPDITRLKNKTKDLLQEIYNVYGQFSAWKLRNMTHVEPPVVSARDKIVSNAAMKARFASLVNK